MSDIKIYLDNEEMSFNQASVILDGSTLVPFRSLFETLGLTVEWDGATHTVTGTRDRFKLTLQIDNPQASVNGKPVELATAPKLLGGSTYVPLRFVGEATGRDVEWKDHLRAVFIRSTPASWLYETLYSSQTVYEGETSNGVPHGKGKYLHNGKLWYEGTFEQGAMEGSGRLIDPQNEQSYYEGGFRQNLMHGQGKMVYDGGNYYIGGFDRAKRQGPGKLYFADGTLAYEGGYDNDKPFGAGTLYSQYGAKYVGTFSDGALFGQVKEYYKDELVYEGEHKGSIRNGPGVEYSKGLVTYRGDFEDGYRYGSGELYSEGKLRYKGKFFYGKPSGSGTFYFPSGKVQFEGKVTGELSGEGRLTFEGGSYYTGEVFRGKPDGQGTLYDASGKVVSEGTFFDGTYVTDLTATEQTEAYKKRLIEKSLAYDVVDGIEENDWGLNPQQAAMVLRLGGEAELEAFKTLSDSAKKELLNDFVQQHWGDVLGVNQAFVIVSYGPVMYAYTETSYLKKSSELKLEYYPEGKKTDYLRLNPAVPDSNLW
ncbi:MULTISPECIES: stalk domain-containing protein [Paenibacillus]|uniref:stalk domain-containing protein n=1 Tax=Paenibacillus TaxID=44249 RepID=UPI0022B8FD6E|nr:stalk domain-containing protein [Paenibacillus caseinilyticus]MCZ8523147.1 stalk domain-containing protein [Paenibacillus caseinilyticus]